MEFKNRTRIVGSYSKDYAFVMSIDDEIEDPYEIWPIWYDIRGFFILKFAYRSGLFTQVRFFASRMGEKHLEGAIGTGALFAMVLLWRKVRGMPEVKVSGFDLAHQMLEGAQKRLALFRLAVDLKVADVTKLPYADGEFDSLGVANAFHCFPNPTDSLKEIYRVLKPGGIFMVNIILYPPSDTFFDRLALRIMNWGIRKGILHTPYKAEAIVAMIEGNGFKISDRSVEGNCLSLICMRN